MDGLMDQKRCCQWTIRISIAFQSNADSGSEAMDELGFGETQENATKNSVRETYQTIVVQCAFWRCLFGIKSHGTFLLSKLNVEKCNARSYLDVLVIAGVQRLKKFIDDKCP